MILSIFAETAVKWSVGVGLSAATSSSSDSQLFFLAALLCLYLVFLSRMWDFTVIKSFCTWYKVVFVLCNTCCSTTQSEQLVQPKRLCECLWFRYTFLFSLAIASSS